MYVSFFLILSTRLWKFIHLWKIREKRSEWYAKRYRKYSKQIAYYIHYFPLQLWIRNFNLHKHRAIKPLNINLSAHEYISFVHQIYK